jgi:hypothetical protein
MRGSIAGMVAAASLWGCTRAATEVRVEIQTDLTVEELDAYRIRVRSDVTDSLEGPFSRRDPGHDLPNSFTIVPKNGDLMHTVTVAVDGLSNGRVTVTSTHAFAGFVRDRVVHLCMFLGRACVHSACKGEQTCGATGCEPIAAATTDEVDPRCAPRPDTDGSVADGNGSEGGALDAGSGDGSRADGGGASDVGWWDRTWSYRLPISISTGAFARADHPVEVEVDFDAPLSAHGVNDPLDKNSIRIVEHNPATGVVIPPGRIVSYFHADDVGRRGVVFFELSGTTAASKTRAYELYFDVGTGHTAPPEWADTTAVGISSGDFNIDNLGKNYNLNDVGIAFSNTSPSPGIAIAVRTTKIHSPADPPFDYGALAADAKTTIADMPYPAAAPPTTRLGEPSINLVELLVELPEGVRIREFIMITHGPWARFYTRFENTTESPIALIQWFDAADTDLPPDSQNNAGGYLMSGVAYACPDLASCDGTGPFIGVSGDPPPDGVQVSSNAAMYLAMRANQLTGGRQAMNVDVNLGQSWSVGPVPAHGTAAVRSNLATASTRAELSATLENLAAPLTVSIGPLEALPGH